MVHIFHDISDVQEVLNLLKRTGIPKEAYVSTLGRSFIMVKKIFLPQNGLEEAVADSTF